MSSQQERTLLEVANFDGTLEEFFTCVVELCGINKCGMQMLDVDEDDLACYVNYTVHYDGEGKFHSVNSNTPAIRIEYLDRTIVIHCHHGELFEGKYEFMTVEQSFAEIKTHYFSEDGIVHAYDVFYDEWDYFVQKKITRNDMYNGERYRQVCCKDCDGNDVENPFTVVIDHKNSVIVS